MLDSAYAEYVQTNDYTDGSQLVEAHDNVVMLRTFSKLYGMAGFGSAGDTSRRRWPMSFTPGRLR